MIFFIVSAINILPQDNTNNMMQDKTDRSNNNDLEKKIEQNANYYASNLKTILNLTDSQMRYIYDIMLDYYLNRTGNPNFTKSCIKRKQGVVQTGNRTT